MEGDVLALYETDWGLLRRYTPRRVVIPESIDDFCRVIAEANMTKTPLVIQGKRRSTAGQSLSDGGIVVVTSKLNQVIEIKDAEVTVEAGLSWNELVATLIPMGVTPPVLTSYLPATIGGTLSTPAFSRGSHLYGLQLEHVISLDVITGDGRLVHCSTSEEPWLFHSVLGGLGCFGVIVRTTLRLVKAPSHLRVQRTQLSGLSALRSSLVEASRNAAAHHITAFPTLTSSGILWWMVQAIDASTTEEGELMSFLSYAAPPRPETPPGSSQWLHLLVPQEGWEPLLLRYARELRFDGGDGVQVLPVLKRRDIFSSLARLPRVSNDTLIAGICLAREHKGRDAAQLNNETRELYQFAKTLGAVSTLGGTLPESLEEWREHLGGSADEVLANMRRADPAGILGGVGVASLRQVLASTG